MWQPDLALSHELIDDTTWEITLREGVKTHTGEEFTAEDVKFTIERILDPEVASTWRRYIDLIDSVTVVNPYKVRIITEGPVPTLMDNLGLIPMVPKEAFEAKGDEGFGESPVGTGPYKFVKWLKGEYVELQAFPDHWRGAPPIDLVEFREIPDDSARLGALFAGDVDIVVNVPPEQIPVIDAKLNLTAKSVPSIRGMYVFIDTQNGPFKDVRVRQAINYLVNVDEIIEYVMGGLGKPTNNMVPPMYAGTNPYLPVEPYPYNPDKAWALLNEAGYTEPFEIVFNGPIGRYLKDREVAQAIAGQLEQEGFKVRYEGKEWGIYFKSLRARQEEEDDQAVVSMLGYGAPHYDTATPWNEFLRVGSKINFWADEEFTRVLDEALSEMDPIIRNALLGYAHQLIVERAPLIFLYQLEDIYGVNDRVDWTPRSDELVWMWEASLKD